MIGKHEGGDDGAGAAGDGGLVFRFLVTVVPLPRHFQQRGPSSSSNEEHSLRIVWWFMVPDAAAVASTADIRIVAGPPHPGASSDRDSESSGARKRSRR